MAARRAPGPSDLIDVGTVTRAHGIRGEVRVAPHDPASDALERAAAVYLGGERFAVEAARRVPAAFLLRLEGVTDRNRAEELRGRAVAVARAELELGEDEVLLADLVGCEAVRLDGTAFGEVVDIEVGRFQSRLVVRDGEVERLVPIVDEIVVGVDLEAGRVVLDPPEGLPETPVGAAGAGRGGERR